MRAARHIALVLWAILSLLTGAAYAVTPAGTLIVNRAFSDYEDDTGKDLTASSNTVQVLVKAVGPPPAAALSVDDTDDSGASTGSPPPYDPADPDDLMSMDHAAGGQYVSFVNEVWNLGGAPDTFGLSFDPAASKNVPAGLTVGFYKDGVLLADTDGDGVPDTGPVPAGGRYEFETRVHLPGAEAADVVVAVRGTSGTDPAVFDLTFDKIGKTEPVAVQVQVEVAVRMGVAAEAAKDARMVVYEYDAAGALVSEKAFRTDSTGVMLYDGAGNVFPVFNHMKDGMSYRTRLTEEFRGVSYFLSPVFYKSDFNNASLVNPGDRYVRGEIEVVVQTDGTKLLVTPLDPAGYTYDAATGARVGGACVSFYRCDDASCDSYTLVDPALLDLYPDGVTFEENPQVSGPQNAAGSKNVGKGAGAFEFRYAAYKPEYDGYYFVGVDYACGLAASNPALADTYNPVPPDKSTLWDPYSDTVYKGGKFWVDKDFPETKLLRVPLEGFDVFRPLIVKKSVNVQTAMAGDVIQFTISARNPNLAVAARGAKVIDTLPAGIRYKPGSARLGDEPQEPAFAQGGKVLIWDAGDLDPEEEVVITFLAYVGAEAGEGRRANLATAQGYSDPALTVVMGSNTATAAFMVKKGVFSDQGYIIGKVYIDNDGDGEQSGGEPGVRGVKIYMEDGRYAITDPEGKYHMDDVDPGTHVLKLDAASLPPGTSPAITGNRNMGEPGSLFADVFPGEAHDGTFRLAPSGAADTGAAPKTVEVVKGVEAVLIEPNTGKMEIRHRIKIRNVSGRPLYDVRYAESSAYAPIEGTATAGGGPLVNPKRDGDGFSWVFPLLEPGRSLTVEYNSDVPASPGDASASVNYKGTPSEGGLTARAAVPALLSSPSRDEFGITAVFPPGTPELSAEAEECLARIVETLRKVEYAKIAVSARGAEDGDEDHTLSRKRMEALKRYLKENLIDMEKVSVMDGSPKTGGSTKARLLPQGARADAGVMLPGVVKKGVYTLGLRAETEMWTRELRDVEVYLSLPTALSYISNSAKMCGEKAEVALRDGFLVVGREKVDADAIEIAAMFLVLEDSAVEGMPYAVFAKDPEGRPVVVDSEGFERHEGRALDLYDGPGPDAAEDEGPGPEKRADWSILLPAVDATVTSRRTDVKVSMPQEASHELDVNGKTVDAKLVGEAALDEAQGVRSYHYVGVPLSVGTNIITLKSGGAVVDRRVITVTGEVKDLSWRIVPDRPPADGKTPVYVVVELKDEGGQLVRREGFVEVVVDGGEVYDHETDTYRAPSGEPMKVKVQAGEAVVRLSPSSTTETRLLDLKLGDIEQRVEVRTYPEKRPWIIIGNMEADAGLNDTKGVPRGLPEMPFDHTDGKADAEVKAGVFAKGTVKDVTLTFRYKDDEEEDTLLQQNVPSTEEGQFYPVYGDSSEQRFEAASNGRFYFKAERGLSYVLYGDYNTLFGREMEFNRYDRTLSGGLVNIEAQKDYMLRSFISSNRQSIVRQTQKGRGVSGPYFLQRRDLVEFSEKVWIEVRDRYNPNMILEKRPMARYNDYQINYEEGWLIFLEPIKEFDDGFNPVLIQIVFESRDQADEHLMYGVRAEKYFLDGRLRIGASGAQEEGEIKDVRIAGVDALWETKDLKVIAEAATTEGLDQANLAPTSGNAYRVEADYKKDDNALRAYYKKVTRGFQNPSATNADAGYETYGASGQAALFGKKTLLKGEFLHEDRDIKRTQSSLAIEQKVIKSLAATAGVRWNREESAKDTLENLLAAYGLSFAPTGWLSLTAGREDVLTGESASTHYPTKTFGRVAVSLTQNVTAYVQGEMQERSDKNLLLTTAGLDTRIGQNTTAYAKYTIDDSVSGWRNQAHLGVNHVFPIFEGFSVDAGAEGVLTLTGGSENKEDFTALRLGMSYLQKESYKLTARYETRLGRHNIEHLATAGGSVKLKEDWTLFVNERWFDSQYLENDLVMGVAYRPVRRDNLNVLTKLRWKARRAEIDENKFIGSINVNYKPRRGTDVMAQYAWKVARVSDTGGSFTDMARVRVLWDVTDRIDFNVHAGILRQHATGTSMVAYGPEVGVRLVKGLWLSAGYNFAGFRDDDFDEAAYWAQGPYVKARFKFDEKTVGKALEFAGIKWLNETDKNR